MKHEPDPRIGARELVAIDHDGSRQSARYRAHGLRVGFAGLRGEERRCACGFGLWAWQVECPRCGQVVSA